MKKNNVILIIADDLGEWALGCYGNKDAITPPLIRGLFFIDKKWNLYYYKK